jgi:polyhydroxyalkanoate synthesis regulator phasin
VTEQSNHEAGSELKSTVSQGIRDLIERAFLVGVGAAVLTKDRVQEVVEEFVRRGQMSGEEGRDMVERLMGRSRDEARSALKKADSSLQGAYRDMGLITKRELEDMEFRLRQVEHRVQLLETAADGSPSGGSGSGATGDSIEA